MGKDKDKDKDKKHKRDRDKDKKSKKEKKSKSKHRRRSSSSSGSDSDVDIETADQQLRRERAAVNKLRGILCTYPAVRKELREMLWRVDQGEAANVSGVPDPALKGQLVEFLELLRLKRNDKGIYGLHSMQQKVLPIVSFVFDEPPRAPTAAAAPASKAAPGAAAAPAPSGKEPETQGATAASGGGGDSPQSRGDAGLTTQHPAAPVGPIGPMGPPAGAVKREPSDNDVDGKVEAVEDDSKAEAGAGRNGDSVKKEEEEPSEAGPGPGPQPRRMAGPAMPPRELLAAAAAAAEALAAAGPGAGGLRYDDDDDDDDDGGLLVGPPPPELVMELEAAPQDEREAEVVRIMKALQELGSTPETVDAYAVLGVEPAAGSAEVKKRYMRLSLLVHPDKCSHKYAHDAFQALATCAKVLQDKDLRAKLDARREDAALRKMAQEAAAAQERERAWRVARGEELPDAGGPSGPSGTQRETWMTELPPELSASVGGGASQQSVRAFSQRGKTGRGDTSAWTDTPEERKAKEAQALLQAASQQYVMMLPAAGTAGPGGSAVGGATAAAMDTYNNAARKKSLMELHLEAQEKAKQEAKEARRAAKKQKKEAAAAKKEGGQDDGDAGDWPWRPFDREKDLEIKPTAKSGAAILKNAGGLGGKFSSAGGTRHFL